MTGAYLSLRWRPPTRCCLANVHDVARGIYSRVSLEANVQFVTVMATTTP